MRGEKIVPSYKDESTGKWFCKFYYTDYTGKRRQKKKRGFDTKREAVAWEREYLLMQQGRPEMSFESLVRAYKKDAKAHLKKSTYTSSFSIIDFYLLPHFRDRRIADITAADIREWRAWLRERKNQHTGNALEPGTLRQIETRLSAIFNFAVKFYDLPSNPMHKAGFSHYPKVKRVTFWTREEFGRFIDVVDEPQYHCLFMLLFYTGMRIGEALALTPADIDMEINEIHVNKTLQSSSGQKYTTTPKTPGSNRNILIPDFLVDEMRTFIASRYELEPDECIFTFSRSSIRKAIQRYAKTADVKQIRLHDLRHSHASLLIEMGFSPLLIADRLGHDSIQTTLNTYSHLYPNKQKEIVEKLNAFDFRQPR